MTKQIPDEQPASFSVLTLGLICTAVFSMIIIALLILVHAKAHKPHVQTKQKSDPPNKQTVKRKKITAELYKSADPNVLYKELKEQEEMYKIRTTNPAGVSDTMTALNEREDEDYQQLTNNEVLGGSTGFEDFPEIDPHVRQEDRFDVSYKGPSGAFTLPVSISEVEKTSSIEGEPIDGNESVSQKIEVIQVQEYASAEKDVKSQSNLKKGEKPKDTETK